jgi:hypothetical protein
MRNERPDLYLKVAAGIVPKELHITSQGIADMSDEEVLRIIDAVRALVAEQGLPQLELQAQSPAAKNAMNIVFSRPMLSDIRAAETDQATPRAPIPKPHCRRLATAAPGRD